MQLVEASQDFSCIFGGDATTRRHHHHDKESCAYFAKRYFNFLKAVPELKSSVLDEEALESMKYI